MAPNSGTDSGTVIFCVHNAACVCTLNDLLVSLHLELRRISSQCWNVEKLLKSNKSGDDDTAAKEKAQHIISDDSELLKALINTQPELYNKCVMIKFMLE